MSIPSAPDFQQRFQPPHLEDPYPLYERLRHEAPIHFSEALNLWVVSRHEDVRAVLGNPGDFLSANAFASPVPPPPEVLEVLAQGYPRLPSLVDADAPYHTRMRAIVSRALAPQRVGALEPRIRELATRMADDFVPLGRAEVVSRFNFPLPARVIGLLLGMPDADLERFRVWTEDMSLLSGGNLPVARQVECARSLVAFQHYMAALIHERRQSPRDDLTSALVATRPEEGPPLEDAELINLVMGLHFGGHETTTNLLGNMQVMLLREPERWKALRDEPTLLPRAVEEAVRLDTPLQGMMRTTRRAVSLGDAELPEGARVLVLFGSANRDAGTFQAPDRFQIRRPDTGRHLGFGAGIHYCLGAQLARLEVRVAMEVLLARMDNPRLQADKPIVYLPNFLHRGPKQLYLEWEPR
ncbi:cytochrome P450 [Myxococcaceae bacterium JPH2]|nr:cytochrome P450 [Myxococcaceae bacterium JPH2]